MLLAEVKFGSSKSCGTRIAPYHNHASPSRAYRSPSCAPDTRLLPLAALRLSRHGESWCLEAAERVTGRTTTQKRAHHLLSLLNSAVQVLCSLLRAAPWQVRTHILRVAHVGSIDSAKRRRSLRTTRGASDTCHRSLNLHHQKPHHHLCLQSRLDGLHI